MAWQFYDTTGAIKRVTVANTVDADYLDGVAASEYVKRDNLNYELSFKSDYAHHHDSRYLPPACKIHRVYDAAATPATAGWFALTGLNVVAYDYNNGTAQADTTNARLYSRETGIYHVSYAFGWAGAFSGVAGHSLFVNGALPNDPTNTGKKKAGVFHWTNNGGSADGYKGGTTADLILEPGEYVSIGVNQPDAVARTVDWNYVFLAMHLVRRL